jgi:hypothetical protein
MMYNYSDHPTRPLTELEVFIGTVHNKHGAQTRRQREKSIKLKDEIDRYTNSIAKQIRRVAANHADESERASTIDDASSTVSMGSAATESNAARFASVELALACLNIACTSLVEGTEHTHKDRIEELVSFRVIAAAVLRREMEWAMPGWTKPPKVRDTWNNTVAGARLDARHGARGGRPMMV